MADMLQTLLLYGRAGFKRNNPRRLPQARQLDRAIDRIELAIATYLVTLDQDNMTRADHALQEAVRAFANNIGHAADVAYRVLGHSSKLRKNGWVLTPDQRDELDLTLAQLVTNQRAAAALFINTDVAQARTLATEKNHFRDLETHAAERELSHIKLGHVDVADVGALYMDVLRDLKSINSYLVGAAACPLLAQVGELLPSRQREMKVFLS
jgi:phosphate:Na+ symporter